MGHRHGKQKLMKARRKAKRDHRKYERRCVKRYPDKLLSHDQLIYSTKTKYTYALDGMVIHNNDYTRQKSRKQKSKNINSDRKYKFTRSGMVGMPGT